MTFPPQDLNRTVLDNGIVALSETIPDTAACGLGLWIRQGSACETGWPQGISHLLEHMYFKGTERRSPRDISQEVESRGGQINASTGRSSISLYTSSLAEDWRLCLDILCDMLVASRLTAEDLQKEQDVVVDEIRLVEESPEEELYDRAFEDLLPGSPWGHPVQGSEESVMSVTEDRLRAFAARQLVGSNLIVSLAGDVTHEHLVQELQARLSDLPKAELPELTPPPGVCGRKDHVRDTGRQAHVQIGRTGPLVGDMDQTAVALLNVALGDGMSSRLFQKLREEQGLCYNVYSWLEGLGRGSAFGVCFSCENTRADEVEAACRLELERLAEQGLESEELERTKRQMRGGLLLGQEQSMNRMVMLARGEHRQGRLVTMTERLERIDALDTKALQDVAKRWFHPDEFFVTRLIP